MADNKPTASLILSGDTLKIQGDGFVSAAFNKEMVKRLFKLPPSKTLLEYGSTTLAASDILTRLTKPAYASFLEVIAADAKLTEEHSTKIADFAAYAHPTSGVWPIEDGLMVLESVAISLPYILYISWKLDGTIWLGWLTSSDVIDMTPAEFQFMMGKTYREYCEELLPPSIDTCQRALSLIAVDRPKRAVVSFINKNCDVDKKTMVYWQDDQVDQYLRRNELSHIATDPE